MDMYVDTCSLSFLSFPFFPFVLFFTWDFLYWGEKSGGLGTDK